MRASHEQQSTGDGCRGFVNLSSGAAVHRRPPWPTRLVVGAMPHTLLGRGAREETEDGLLAPGAVGAGNRERPEEADPCRPRRRSLPNTAKAMKPHFTCRPVGQAPSHRLRVRLMSR